ncbi:DRC9 protein, partial [Geococcyx californianus]|nr:DRC9 protein [Geococcyx californianus]
MEKLTYLEALEFSAVLEECVDQLSVLGYIMPGSCKDKTVFSHIGSQEIKEIPETQRKVDINDQELMSARRGSRENIASTSLKSTEHKQQRGKTEGLKSTHHLSSRATEHSAPFAKKFRKIQADRQYASDVITATMKELQESGTFNSLTEANEREKAETSKIHDALIREEEGKKKIKALQKQLQNVKKETERELKNRDDMIAYLRHKLEVMKIETDMERRYMKKITDLQVCETQKKCHNAESGLEKEIQKLKSEIEDENRVHMETEKFLRKQYKIAEEKLKHWINKYKNDMDAKEKELDALKAARANNLEIMQRVAKECLTFEETIIGDRTEKETERRKIEQEALELKSILKLQAWWRGTMVRRNLGPYKVLNMMQKKKLSQQQMKGKKKNSEAKKKTR